MEWKHPGRRSDKITDQPKSCSGHRAARGQVLTDRGLGVSACGQLEVSGCGGLCMVITGRGNCPVQDEAQGQRPKFISMENFPDELMTGDGVGVLPRPVLEYPLFTALR